MSVHGCRGVVPLAAGSAQLAAFVGRDMLRGAFAAIASSGIAARADLLHLARDILSRQLPLPPEPREVGFHRLPLTPEPREVGFHRLPLPPEPREAKFYRSRCNPLQRTMQPSDRASASARTASLHPQVRTFHTVAAGDCFL